MNLEYLLLDRIILIRTLQYESNGPASAFILEVPRIKIQDQFLILSRHRIPHSHTHTLGWQDELAVPFLADGSPVGLTLSRIDHEDNQSLCTPL